MDSNTDFRNQLAREERKVQEELQTITRLRREHAPRVLRYMARAFARDRTEYHCHSKGDCGYIDTSGSLGITVWIRQYDAAGRPASVSSSSITKHPPPEEDAKFFAHFLETHSDGMAKCSYQMDKEAYDVICHRVQQ